MCAALPGHPFSRWEKRMAFIVRHGLAFLISIVFFMLPLEESAKQALNTLFITPLMIFINTSFYIIIACPCLQGEHSPGIKSFFECLEGLSLTFAHFCCLISIVWVIIAGALTYSDDNYATLAKYIYQVVVFGLGLECILLWIKFFSSTFCIKFKVCGIPVFTVSDWFYEYCEYEQLERLESNLFIIPLLLTFTVYTTSGVSQKELEVDIERCSIQHVEVEDNKIPPADVTPADVTPTTEIVTDVAPPPPRGSIVADTAPTLPTADVAPPAPRGSIVIDTAPTLPTADVAPPAPRGSIAIDVAPPAPTESTATEVAPVPPVENAAPALPPGLAALEEVQTGFN